MHDENDIDRGVELLTELARILVLRDLTRNVQRTWIKTLFQRAEPAAVFKAIEHEITYPLSGRRPTKVLEDLIDRATSAGSRAAAKDDGAPQMLPDTAPQLGCRYKLDWLYNRQQAKPVLVTLKYRGRAFEYDYVRFGAPVTLDAGEYVFTEIGWEPYVVAGPPPCQPRGSFKRAPVGKAVGAIAGGDA